ncbi:hypothetical protein ABE504_25185 [Paenibacillus oryzisoli]|uniref:hypothetical protein n=1 Tax=Paenibacillus oryzisoli TaxID=1850517 RepID=UPI003D26AA83
MERTTGSAVSSSTRLTIDVEEAKAEPFEERINAVDAIVMVECEICGQLAEEGTVSRWNDRQVCRNCVSELALDSSTGISCDRDMAVNRND